MTEHRWVQSTQAPETHCKHCGVVQSTVPAAEWGDTCTMADYKAGQNKPDTPRCEYLGWNTDRQRDERCCLAAGHSMNADGTGHKCIDPDIDSPVNHPKHYNSHPSGVECIQIAEHYSFNLGNAIKYIWRAGIKSDKPLEDLRKAAWYINREIEKMERK